MYSTNSLLVFISCTISLTSSNYSEYNYEKMHRFGLGRRLIPDYRRLNPRRNFGFESGHPLPLPEPKKMPYVAGPYRTIVQGKRKKGDYRAFVDKFEYDADYLNGHRYFCETMLHCKITFLSMQTDSGIPILLRGGVGYRHFYVIARVAAGVKLNGSVTAYCMKMENRRVRRYQYGLVGQKGDYFAYS